MPARGAAFVPVPADPSGAHGPVSISIEGLRVHRGKSTVLANITASIPEGHITGLLGPSGSGKTTLMRTIVGLQKISAGTVTVLGRLAGDPQNRHDVGYLTQSASVYRDLSVIDNVRYFAALQGASREQTHAALAAVGMSALGRRRAGQLSGGQLSRVSLACALVGRPRLLVLDEPTVGLDPILRADLWARFAAMAAAGTTLIISSHVMEEAGHCDSLLLLREGLLLAQLTPAQLRVKGRSEELELAFLHIIEDSVGSHPEMRGAHPDGAHHNGAHHSAQA
ncbi:ABC transporter ATP-binding protein [Arthrobacter sp. TMP15]